MKDHTIIPPAAQEHYLNSNINQRLNGSTRASTPTHIYVTGKINSWDKESVHPFQPFVKAKLQTNTFVSQI